MFLRTRTLDLVLGWRSSNLLQRNAATLLMMLFAFTFNMKKAPFYGPTETQILLPEVDVVKGTLKPTKRQEKVYKKARKSQQNWFRYH